MPDFRSFFLPEELEPTRIVLDPDESHHLVAINRARQGDTVVVFDGRGNEWICECIDSDRRQAVLKVRFQQRIPALPYRITLAQAVPKGRSMDFIIRKATEIGVVRIAPLYSERTEVRLEKACEEQKVAKWRSSTIEAAKQSGIAHLPEILAPQTARSFMETMTLGHDLKLVASLQAGARTLRSVLSEYQAEHNRLPMEVVWMVGPEGDFTPAEMGISKNAGFEPVSLGPLVLRCETAAVYALSILSYELQQR
jgi:16S rRNA (uracil1498-N3)-methyltransferase